MATDPDEERERPELVFGLVGPVGTRMDDLSRALQDHLTTFDYKCEHIRLSDLLRNAITWKEQEGIGEFHRIRHGQDMGDAFREKLQDGAALAQTAIAEIRVLRRKISGSPDRPAAGYAYILRQLKHPDEVELLRMVYGSSFLLIGGHAPCKARVDELMRLIAQGGDGGSTRLQIEGQAKKLIEDDERRGGSFGQNIRDAYPRADCFVQVPDGTAEVNRFLDLLFGHPFRTPSPDEYAMYLASAASLRSSDENRQVGAVIVRRGFYEHTHDPEAKNLDIIAVGMNEVPRAGGGSYWDKASPDARDQAVFLYKGEDRAREIKLGVLSQLIGKLREKGWLREDVLLTRNELIRELLPHLAGTQFIDIGEFSRPVHAEMAALLDSARRGVAVDGQTMYVTTFPCHNCAKHIIDAGIRRVVYLEPYPKSRVAFLYQEDVELDPQTDALVPGKVVFCPFTGVAPRQYQTLFSMSRRGAKGGRSLRDWQDNPQTLLPAYVSRNAAILYLAEERHALEKLRTDVYPWDKAMVCPSR